MDKLKVTFADDLRGIVLPFPPGGVRGAIEITNVVLIPDEVVQYAMDDDTSPCEMNPDPFFGECK
jgi:hypothetical protein